MRSVAIGIKSMQASARNWIEYTWGRQALQIVNRLKHSMHRKKLWKSEEFLISPSVHCSTRIAIAQYMKDRQAFPSDSFQHTPGDRLHRDIEAFPWHPFSLPGDTLHEDKQVFPWGPSRWTRRRTSQRQTSPRVLLRADYIYVLGPDQWHSVD